MAIVSKEKYSQEKIEKLAKYIRMYAEREEPIEFEILVDGFKAVRRTSDPDMFNAYEEFVDGSTKSIEIILFTGTSNNNDKHILYFDGSKEAGLSGVDIEEHIKEQVAKERERWDVEQLKDKNKALKEEIEDLEDEVEQLQKQLAQAQAERSPLNGVLGDFGSTLVESFIRRNPKLLAKIPGGEALAGVLNETDTSSAPTQETNVQFERVEVSEDDKAGLQFVNQLKARFSQPEFERLLVILNALAQDKPLIEEVIEFIESEEEGGENNEQQVHS